MSNEEKCTIKMSGYLEKKSKMKVMSSWKTYWFVLEGRLLLYYRSKDTLSPCKGSINLGPRCTVKPAVGGTCIFQIETRSNTIILKAPNRLEQEKWLQAILGALNQSASSPSGMVHFRYSSDDLIQIPFGDNKKGFAFTRQNTMPERLKMDKGESKQRLDRLQNIGGKSYGGSLETIQKLAKAKSPLTVKRRNTKKQSRSSHDVTFTSGDESLYSNVPKRKTYSGMEHRSSFMVDNDQYITTENDDAKTEDVLRNKPMEVENVYERVSGDSQIENDVAVVDSNLYARVSSDSDVMVENYQYALAKEVMKETETVNYHEYSKQVPENIYSVPQVDTDHNDNNVVTTPVRQNDEVNPYSICQIYPKKLPEEKLYEVPDEYAEPLLPPRPSVLKINETHHDSIATLLSKLKIFGTHSGGHDKDSKVEKKGSFLRKFFKKKNRKHIAVEEQEEDEQYVTIDDCVIDKLERNPDVDKQILEELKKILINKKESLKVQMKHAEETNTGSGDVFSENATGKPLKPALPHKQKKSNELLIKLKSTTGREMCQDGDDHPEKIKTIDEILSDLNSEKLERDLKLGNINESDCTESREDEVTRSVKQLIDKFNNVCTTDEAILRQKSNKIVEENVYRHSDELNRLLNELIKVTNAPILTPGVTTSLGASLTSGDELMVSCKRRRCSDPEPDYDIPRPHSNLKIDQNDDRHDDDSLTATRFFGPVLTNNRNSTALLSMTPDSLEPHMMKSNTTSDFIQYAFTIQSPPPVNLEMRDGCETENLRRFSSDVFVDSLEPISEMSTIL